MNDLNELEHMNEVRLQYYRDLGLPVEYNVNRHLGDEIMVSVTVYTKDKKELFECRTFENKWYFASLLEISPDIEIHEFVGILGRNIKTIENKLDFDFIFPNRQKLKTFKDLKFERH